MIDVAINYALATLIIALAIWTILAPSLLQSIFSFMIFGLVIALIWTKLNAPDVALAEAAIGSGLTSVLFLDTFREIYQNSNEEKVSLSKIRMFFYAVLVLIVVGCIISGLILTDAQANFTHQEVTKHMEKSEVKNPVTAVLLNFRGYDTLLEIIVIFVVVVGTLGLNHRRDNLAIPFSQNREPTQYFLSILLPIILLTALYILWIGTDKPGGAFQAATLVATTIIILHMVGLIRENYDRNSYIHYLVVIGPLFFFVVVCSFTFLGSEYFFQYPSSFTKGIMLLIESVLTVSLGVMLALLYLGAPSWEWSKD